MAGKLRTATVEEYATLLRRSDLDRAEKGRYFDGMCKLLSSAEKRRVRVKWARAAHAVYYAVQQLITLRFNSRAPREMLHELIHEFGHMLIEKKFASNILALDAKKMRDKLLNMHEEFEAWTAGRQYARKLGISCNERMLNSRQTRALKSYALWLTKGCNIPELMIS